MVGRRIVQKYLPQRVAEWQQHVSITFSIITFDVKLSREMQASLPLNYLLTFFKVYF